MKQPRLRQRVGDQDDAIVRLLTGDFIDASRAVATGLVSRVVPDADLDRAAEAMARNILRNSPLGVRLTKECLRYSVDAPTLEAAIAMEDRNQILTTRTNDVKEGIADHRAMAEAHLNAARCLEAGRPEKDCHAQLAKDCKGLGIGKYCGMKHKH